MKKKDFKQVFRGANPLGKELFLSFQLLKYKLLELNIREKKKSHIPGYYNKDMV